MLALSDIQLSGLQFNTQAYIDNKPVTIALIPTRGTAASPIAKPGGGHDFIAITRHVPTIPLPNDDDYVYTAPSPRAPQQFRLISQPGPGTTASPHDDGVSRKSSYTLIGAANAIVAVGDSWSEGSNHYHVDSLEPANGYEVRANVTAFATVPTHG